MELNQASPPPAGRGKIPRPRIITSPRKPDASALLQAPKLANAAGSTTAAKAPSGGLVQNMRNGTSSASQNMRSGTQSGSQNMRNGTPSSGSPNMRNGTSPTTRRHGGKKLDSTSASSLPVLSFSGTSSGKSVDNLEDENNRLKIALQGERNSLKQLRREMIVQLKQAREDEQHKSTLMLKDMKSRLHFEKVRELEIQKENLNRKFEGELQKISKVKEAEARKLHADVQKLQDELQLNSASTCNTSVASSNLGSRGLSANARQTFETERTKLQKEIQDLATARRLKEEELNASKEKEKQLLFQMKKEREDHSAKLTKLKKETDIEIRRLCDELKVKDRQLLSGDHGTPKKREDTSHSMGLGNHGNSADRRKPQRYHSSSSLQDEQFQPSSWTPKSSELSSKLKVKEDKVHVLEEEKIKLMARVKELENKSKPLTEKNKKLFDKNVELSSHNKSLEDTIRQLTKENEYLKSEVASESTTSPLSTKRTLSVTDGGYEESYEDIVKEVKTLRRQALENDKTIAALKLACAEKDRRIELILHRKRKQRVSKAQNKNRKSKPTLGISQKELAAGIKETYFGYDEADSQSIDSELSLSVCSSTDMIDDEEVFEDFTREEFQQNYQRLVKEHMEMERSFALLQATHGAGFVDPQRESKMRTQLESDLLDAQSKIEDLEKLLKAQGKDTGWLEEKERLNRTIRTLKEKLRSKEDSERKLSFQMEEVQEQNEVLEFRTLELEDQVEKEVSLATLRSKLESIKEEHTNVLSTQDKINLVQAVTVVDTAEKKIKDLLNKTEALKNRISSLEEEKASILSSHEGVSTDLVLEYESTRNHLLENQLKIGELESELDRLRQAEAVYQYKESHFEKREEHFKEEITLLRQRLTNSNEGREYENEIFLEKINALKLSEERVKELTSRCTELERECLELHEQLTLQDNESLTESDKDNEIRMASQQGAEKSETERMEKYNALEKDLQLQKEKNDGLVDEIRTLTDKLKSVENERQKQSEQFRIENLKLVDQNRSLQNDLESCTDTLEECITREEKFKSDHSELQRCLDELSESSKIAEDELEKRRKELVDLKKHCSDLECELEDAQIEIENLQSDAQINKNTGDRLAYSDNAYSASNQNAGAFVQDKHGSTVPSPHGAKTGSYGSQTGRSVQKCTRECQTDTSIDEVLRNESAKQNLMSVQIEELKVEVLNLKDVVIDREEEIDVLRITIRDAEYLRNENEELEMELSEKDGIIDSDQTTMKQLRERIQNFETELEENLAKKDTVIAQLENKILQSQNEIDELNETIVQLQNDDKKDLIQELESRVLDLNIKLESFRNVLKQKDRQLDALINKRRDASHFKDRNLLMVIEEKKEEIGKLNIKVTSLEKAEQESAKKILELLDIKSQLNNRIRVLETDLEVSGRDRDTEQARAQIEDLERGKQKLHDKVGELQELLEEEVSRSKSLEKQLTASNTNQDLQDRLSVIKSQDANKHPDSAKTQDASRDVNIAHGSPNQVQELESKLKASQTELEALKNSYDELQQEKTQRIEWLEERLNCMEDNELKLSETIVELEEVEKDLRDRVEYYEKTNQSGNVDTKSIDSFTMASSSDELAKSKMAEQNLRDRVEQMSLNEQILRENISELQDKLDKYEREGTSTFKSEGTDVSVKSTQSRADDLEDKVRQLVAHESELLEQIYQLNMENEELQEHVDQLIASRGESSSPESTPRVNKHDRENEQLRQRLLEVESENEELKDKILHAKLESIQTGKESDFGNVAEIQAHVEELEDERCRLKELLYQLESERNVLIEQNQEIEKQLMHMDEVEQELEQEQEESKQLREKVELLSDSEEKLMSSVQSLEEANEELRKKASKQGEATSRELQEHKVKIQQMRSREQGFLKVIETLKADKDKAADQSDLNEEVLQLRERVDILLDAQEKMVDRIQQQEEIEENLKKQLQDREDEIQDVEQRLRQQLLEETRQLQEQLQQQEEVEDSLQKQLDEYKQLLDRENEEKSVLIKENDDYAETNEQLQEDLDQLLDTQKQMQDESNQLQAQCQEQEKQLNDLELQLQSRIVQLQDTEDQLHVSKSALDEANEKIQSLEKVGEKAKEKLSQLESKDSNTDSFAQELQRTKDDAQVRIRELEQSHADMATKLGEYETKHGKQQIQLLQLKESLDEAQLRIEEYMERERNIREELEQVSNDYEEQITAMQKELHRAREEHGELEQLVKGSSSMEDFNVKINEYEDNEKALKTKINELQAKNAELLNSLKELDESVSIPEKVSNGGAEKESLIRASGDQVVSKSSPETLKIDSVEKVEPEVVQKLSQIEQKTSQDISKDASDFAEFSLQPSASLDVATMQNMPKEDLMTKVCELQELESYHRKKIREMSDNLAYLRQAVEVVTVALETDAELPLHKDKPKAKDTAYEERLNQLVKAEMSLKLRVIELEKREKLLRRDVEEAEEALQTQHGEYKAELDELESELDNSKKREAKLRNKLEYGVPGQENAAVAQIQHLEELVLDLEASERKLKRLVKEQRDRELKMKYKIEELETNKNIFGTSMLKGDSDKHWELLQTIRTLESSQLELKGKVTELQKDDVDAMAKRIGELERSEKSLKMKLELLETQEPSFLENLDLGSLDSPEAILKQRVLELEQMERHLKEQVVELEKDREELHDIARADKNVIHELNVQVRELQLSERNLRDQLNKYDIEDRQLHSKVDELSDEKERLEEQLKQVQHKERHLNAQLQQVQYQETEMSMQLQSTRDDYENQQSKLRRKVSDAEDQRRKLQHKIDALSERVDDLESIEISMKQKVRSLENSEAQHKDKIRDMEKTESSASARLAELEATNEVLSERVHKLEEEKSQLIYEMSDVQITKDEHHHEKERFKHQIKLLTDRTEDAETKKTSLQAELDELTHKHVTMHARLQEHESADKQWQEKVSYLEMREVNLNAKVAELQEQLDSATAALNATGEYETERNKLESVAAFHRQESERAENENQKLKERLERMEHTSRDEMASIPLAEITLLRSQAEKLAESEKLLKESQEREAGLREDLERSRDGKDCGHATEIKELKKSAEQYNKAVQEKEGISRALARTKKAHELQKQNHEEIKKQLELLQEKVKSGDVSLKARSAKAVQVKLSEEYTLKNLSSEFKRALRNLGARHPEAYDDFVKLLQPAEKKVSRVHVTKRVTSDDDIEAEAVDIQQSSPNKESSADGGVVTMVEKQRGEKQLWRTVERKRSVGKEEDIVHPQWSAIERNMGDTEEMTLTINFGQEADGYASDSSSAAGDIGGLLRKDANTKSSDSIQSAGSIPPPLPVSIPPAFRTSQSPSADSYYLPSADEASEIEDDSAKMRKLGQKLRAKSADRDSDYSEMTAPISMIGQKTQQMAHSLDSIPDDSGYHDVDNRILREKIAYLEEEIKKREEQIVQSNEDSVKAEAFVKVKSQLLDTERKLEEERRQKTEKEKELSSVKLKVEQLEKTRPPTDKPDVTLSLTSAQRDLSLLQAQLDRKEKELSAKNNEVDRLTQELRKWQEDYRETQDSTSRLEYNYSKLEKENSKLRTTKEQFTELLQDHTALKQEHEELEGKYNSLASVDKEREQLEKQVVDLRFQLAEFEALSLDHDDMQAKVKSLSAEVKDKAKLESQLTKDNAQLRHAVEALKRDNLTLREHESEYKLVREQYEAMEEVKRKAQTMLTPLRAKVLRLSQQCKARDELIRRLTQQLRKYEDGSDVIRAADTVVQASQDYSRPISPLTSQFLTDLEKEIKASDVPPLHVSTKRSVSHGKPGYTDSFHSNQNSVSPRSNQSGSDVDELLDPNFINHNNNVVKTRVTHTSVSNPDATKSASINNPNHVIKADVANGATTDLRIPPQASLPPVTQLNLEKSNAEFSYHSNASKLNSANDKPFLYRAIKDYDPRYYSRSGHQHMELTLHEGAIVKPLGGVDTSGYLEAQCNGKVGLVPVNYLEPVKDRTISVKQLNSQASGAMNGGDQILQIHSELTHANASGRSAANVSSVSNTNQQLQQQQQQQQRPPNQRSLSLAHPAFRRPQVTLQPRSRPTSQPAFRTTSPNQGMLLKTAASISLPVSQRSTPRSTPPLFDAPDPPSRFRVVRVVGEDAVLLAWNAPSLDELTRSNGILIKGYKIFINNKDKQHVPSPFMTKALVEHLNLRRPHTFSIQTLGDNGQVSALVDTAFEDVLPELLDGQREQESLYSSEGDTRSSVQSSTHLEGERRMFMGVYDYSPKSQSPNAELVKQELSFRMGDIIVVYGDQREDGYYFGKVHGKKGLVPGSFVEEVALLKSKSKRSTSSGSTVLSPRYTPSVSSSNCSADRTQLSNHSSSNKKSQAC